MKLKSISLLLLLAVLMLVLVGCGRDGQTADTPTQLPMATPTPYPTYTSVLPTATQVPLIPTPTSAPEEGGICTLTGGEIVKEGWSGKDTGSNHCNQCTCLDVGLACTKMACPTVNISPTDTSTVPTATPTPTPTNGHPTPPVISTSAPPYKGTLWIRNSSEIINESDPTLFDTLTKISDNPRKMYDDRNGWITVTPFLFEATFTDGQIIEVQVNPEFESVEIAREIALMYVGPIGRLPAVLRQDVETIWLHKGDEPFGGGNDNLLIHHEKGLEYITEGILEEAFLHEASHTSLDSYHYNNSWGAAQKADGNFISTYARDYPTREDVAESFPMYYALRYKPSRISDSLRDAIINTIPNRVIYFDENLPSLESVAFCPVPQAEPHPDIPTC